MLLLIGPPGSGKTQLILRSVRDRLAAGRQDFRLVVPTATAAEHLQNILAREGFVLRPSVVSTLSKFARVFASGCNQVSAAALDRLIEQALTLLDPKEFRAVAALTGFRAALARTIEELSAAGCTVDDLGVFPALQAVYGEVEAKAGERGEMLSGAILKTASRRIREQGLPGAGHVFFDGFFGFTDPELGVIEALRAHAGLTVTLPDWEGAEASRAQLAAMGFEQRRCDTVGRQPRVVLIRARTQEREIDEIAARILDEASTGRAFREMGIIVRSVDPYVPALQTTLERFGIPARFYFSSPLAHHSLVRRIAGSDELAAWRGRSATPPEWVTCFGSLLRLLSQPSKADPAQSGMVEFWRTGAVAVRAFKDALRETGARFGTADDVSFAALWTELNRVLRLTALRVPDHRHNVVHVMDVFEARQWELPVFFVCGLTERQFPAYHSQDPILTDGMRARLRAQRIRVPTSAERNQTERVLFELATTRAKDTLVLSYPQFNAKGDETLRSFCLERYLERTPGVRIVDARLVRPVPRGSRSQTRRPVILDDTLREWLAQRHMKLAPTALEAFLQCPFQFFVNHTLRLEEPPLEPEQRFDAAVQGKLLHEVLARWIRGTEEISSLFEEVFMETCAREEIPAGYRTEAIRLEMLRHLQRFVGQATIPGARVSLTEHQMTLPLENDVTLNCRLDRIDRTTDSKALIIDYKYSAPQSVARLVKGHEEGTHLQGGIYMLAARNSGEEICGMLFAGVRKEPSWEGWHTLPSSLRRGTSCVPQVLHEVMEHSRQAALDAIARIREGVIAPEPADGKRCVYCAGHDICRVESMEGAVATAEGGIEE